MWQHKKKKLLKLIIRITLLQCVEMFYETCMKNTEKRMVLRLQSGRKIYLDEIVQWRTYSSLLLGIPDKQMNDEIIARALQHARKKIDLSVPIHLLQPPRENLNFSRNKSVRPHREYERIPPIACAAAFESSEPARDQECFYSCLIFLWFQTDWALPIAPHILTQIRKINWNELAEDCMP